MFAQPFRASRFFIGVSLIALTPTFGHAQTALPNAAEGVEEAGEIIVTGSVLQNQAEINTRRQATAIVDTLSRDDIGALPDITVAESLRRITGVTTIYNDDIGQFASIRGVHPDFVPVTVNGLAVATTGDLGEGTRKVNLQVIPGEAVRQLQAYKTPSPNLDAGALGGLINIDTISAFDPNRTLLSITAGVSYSAYMAVPDDNSGGDPKNSPFGKSFSASWMPRFGDDRFGLAITGIYEERPRTQSNNAITNRGYYSANGATTTPESADWNGYAAPDSFVSHNYTNKFTKYGGTARLDFRPNDQFSTSLFGFAYFSDEQETRNTNRIFGLDQAKNQTENTGTMRAKSADVQWRYNTFERDQHGIQWKSDLNLGNKAKLSANLGYSYAWFRSERPYATFLYKPNTRLSYDLGNPGQLFLLDNANAYIDPVNYKLNTIYSDTREATENVYEARLDFNYNNAANDQGLGFAAGVDFRTLDMKRDNTAIYYKPGSASLSGISFVPDFKLPGYSYPGLWLNQQKFWKDVVPTLAIDTVNSDIQSRINDYRYRENVYAAYANANYTSDLLRVDAGLRLDHVTFSADMAQVLDGVLQKDQIRKQGKDTHVLPYLIGRLSLSPKLRIKGAASKTLGRPNPEAIATAEQVDEAELTISRGNPDIKPLISTNLDLGIEYYFNTGRGMVTGTVFSKNIRDDILSVSTSQQVNGDTYIVTQPINGEKTRYKGVELGVINNSFGNVAQWLSPVGVSANAIWTSGTTGFFYNGGHRKRDDLQFQSDFAANGAVFYSFTGGSEIRLAVNHQGRYLEEFAANPWQEIVIAPFTTFDLTTRWAINSRIQLRLEGRNIFSANRQRLTGPSAQYDRAGLEVGSSWFARLNYRL